jgi:hypothetical protein
MSVKTTGNRTMYELIRTNDVVLLSFATSLLKDAGIHCLTADESISVLEGSIPSFQRRLLVTQDEAQSARDILTDAGLEAELRQDSQ